MKLLSIRPFIGAKDFEICKQFYHAIGFEETILSPVLSVFKMQQISFYLQNAYVKDWLDNTMIFVEVDNANDMYELLLSKNIMATFTTAKLQRVKLQPWGAECFLHDPSGVLWHFGHFNA